MALKLAVRDKIMKEVLRPVKGSDWKVLVVDQQSMRMISACYTMTELLAEKITLVEDIFKRREPLPCLEAVYLVTPSEKSIDCIIKDFKSCSECVYRACHIFMTGACPDEIFSKLCKSSVGKFMRTLREISLAFLPFEKQVFSLDSPESFLDFYNPSKTSCRSSNLERCAEQIATLCATLGEYPIIRQRSDFEKNEELARLVQQKLDAYKADDPTIGQGPGKERSQLLIVDRGFDPISPLLHELTLQAMAYDLLPIQNDIYKYESLSHGDVSSKEVLLNEDDEIWLELRHQHIAVVSQEVTHKLKEFTEDKRISLKDKSSTRDLSQMIKMMPHYQKELTNYSTHLHLAEDCMKKYQGRVDELCRVEQDMVMGVDANGEKTKDALMKVILLLDESISTEDKCRIIIIYIITNGGISEEKFLKLLEHAKIHQEETQLIHKIRHLGITILREGDKKKPTQNYLTWMRRERSTVGTYQMSRWTPYIKDIMEDVLEEKLDVKKFPYLGGVVRNQCVGSTQAASSRYCSWHKDKNNQSCVRHFGPRLIIFFVGGVTMSEMRSAYELTSAYKNWEILIGSTHILKPQSFLDSLKSLPLI